MSGFAAALGLSPTPKTTVTNPPAGDESEVAEAPLGLSPTLTTTTTGATPKRTTTPAATRESPASRPTPSTRAPASPPAPPPAPDTLPDYYAILRVSPSATPDQIRKAAKIRRIAVHPDTMRRKAVQQGKKLSKADEERIDRVAKEVGEAAEVLENITSKMDYDATR